MSGSRSKAIRKAVMFLYGQNKQLRKIDPRKLYRAFKRHYTRTGSLPSAISVRG